jgi:hypothetical protein
MRRTNRRLPVAERKSTPCSLGDHLLTKAEASASGTLDVYERTWLLASIESLLTQTPSKNASRSLMQDNDR